MANDLETGKTWVRTTLLAHAKKGGLDVGSPRFERLPGARDCHVLWFEVGSQIFSATFTAEELETCWKDRNVRAEVTSRIRAILRHV